METLDPWRMGFGGLASAQHQLEDLCAKRDAKLAQLDVAMQDQEVQPVTT